MLNVGLVTVSVMPRPRARPWTNVVFPTPRFPCRARVESAGSAAASSVARACVSAADAMITPARSLSQMLVAMILGEVDRRCRKCVVPDEAADARELRAGECTAPRVLEMLAVGAVREREHQFI